MFILGVCVCNTGFIGFDCSVTLSAAPTELTIPNKGLCSTKTRLCQKTNIFSIFYSENVYCKFQHFTVSQLKQIYFRIRFWNYSGSVTAYLFIHLFIYFIFELLFVRYIVWLIMNIAHSLGHISIAQIGERDWLMFNVNYRNISAWWSYMTKHSNQSAGVTNNQCNRGLIAINNVNEKG